MEPEEGAADHYKGDPGPNSSKDRWLQGASWAKMKLERDSPGDFCSCCAGQRC